MKHQTYKVATLGVAFILASVGLTKEWNRSGAPTMLDPSYQQHFELLPLKAKLEGPREPWCDHSWPNFRGGITSSPNSSTPDFSPLRPTREEMFSNTWGATRREKAGNPITLRDLQDLSPAEKFDLYRARYDYPLTNLVLKMTSANQPKWIGLSQGWAAAAISHAEPSPLNAANRDGFVIHFGSSDVKALMSYYYGVYAFKKRQVKQLGKNCRSGGLINIRKCSQDVNVGALHVILANQIGLKDRGFIVDTSRFGEIFNQPVVGYEMKVLEKRDAIKDAKNLEMAKRSSKEVLIETTMLLGTAIEPSSIAVVGTEKQKLQSMNYKYWLELDANDLIIGGRYVSGDLTPDFIWNVNPMKFDGDFSALNEIYSPAALQYVQF